MKPTSRQTKKWKSNGVHRSFSEKRNREEREHMEVHNE